MDVGQLQTALKLDVSGFSDGVIAASKSLDTLKGTLSKVAGAMTALLTNPVVLAAAGAAALIGLGKAAYDSFKEIDKAYDKITTATGAVGSTLDGLKASFDNVFQNATYVDSAEELAGTIADLNTYLGVTGPALETIATQISNLGGMNADVEVDSLSQAFNRWGVSTDEMSGYLDYFFDISQRTGISIKTLTDSLTSNQATLSTLGFSLQESTRLLGEMNKAGFEVSDISQAFKQLTANGITTREQFEDLIYSIKHAETQTDALSIASEAFGTRAKDAIVQLIQSGGFDNLTDSIDESTGAINNAAESTQSFGDRMAKVGRRLTEFMSGAGAVIEGVLNKLLDFFSWIGGLIGTLFEPIKNFIGRIAETFAKFWSDGEENTGNAIDNIAGVIEKLVDIIAGAIDWFLNFIWPVIEGIISTLVAGIKFVTAVFAGDWETARQMVCKIALNLMQGLYNIMETGWNVITTLLETVINGIITGVIWMANRVIDVFEWIVNGAIDLINGIISAINLIPGVNITALGHVNWELETPEVDFGEFQDSFVGGGMNAAINALDYWSKPMEEAQPETNITMNFNSPQYDYVEVSRATEQAAAKLAQNNGMRY